MVTGVLILLVVIPVVMMTLKSVQSKTLERQKATVILTAPKNGDVLDSPVTLSSMSTNTISNLPAEYEIVTSSGQQIYNGAEIPYRGSSVVVTLPAGDYTARAVVHGWLAAGTPIVKTEFITFTVK